MVLALALFATAVASGEDALIPITWKGEKGDAFFKESPARLTQAQAVAVAKLSAILDSETKIDFIETPFDVLLKDIGDHQSFSFALDVRALKEAGVTKNQFITFRTEKLPLRQCLHRLLEPLKLTFVICPDGLLITSPEKKP